ncbi:MAG: hypothetical protein HF314_18340 [Ignavibacteria bacterium]|jgi:hypothetical protein|nr:hypothetical protein [Ignavibacteria bacterium]MCU7505049.1 hypothetical protein [Ignavibacteria bacterium]
MKAIFNKKILTFELLLLLLLNVVFLNLPLTNILGYEYSVINGILITFLSAIFTASLLKNSGTEKSLPLFFRELIHGLLPLVILPFVMGLLAAFFVRNCSLLQGVAYYLVLTVPSFVVGSALGLISFLISRKYVYLILTALYLAILFFPVLNIYFNPQIYFYNPVIGYFPGTIYDEALKIDFKLVSYRLLNLVYFAAAAYFAFYVLVRKDRSKTFKAVYFASLLSVAAIFILSGDTLGFLTSRSRLISELGGHVSSQHFEVYYDAKINPRTVKNILLHDEYYLEQVAGSLKVKPSKKVTVFLFYDSKEKKGLMGSANADVAKPWLYQIYINFSNFEETLQHEIVHCVSSEFGATPFKISYGFNPALLEGLAVALEDNYDEHTIHYMAALAYNNNFRFPIERLLTGFNFFGELSSLSYIYSGSFIKFLIDKYGAEGFKEIYQGGDWQQAYGKPPERLISEYYAFISSFKPVGSKDEAFYYFGRKPIFKKVCARFLAEKVEQGFELYNSGQYYKAEALFKKLLEYSESYQSLLGYVNSLRKTDKPGVALQVLKRYLNKYDETSYFYGLELLAGDLAAENKDFSGSALLYENLASRKASREYGYLAALRKELLKDTARADRYLKGSDFDKYSILRQMNKDSVNYSSLPVLIGLSERLQENYNEFLKQWTGRLKGSEFNQSYADFRLSDYALRNMELQEARNLTVLALSYKGDSDYSEVLRLQLRKVNWFINFGENVLSGAKWQ